MGNLTCTASGSVANFYTPYAVPIRSFKVHFSPKQSGSGDPSPSNVRSIEGWTGVTGYRCGKNLFDLSVSESESTPSDSGTSTKRTFIPNTYVVGINPTNNYRKNYSTWVLNFSISNGVISFESGAARGYGVGFVFENLKIGETYTISATMTNAVACFMYYKADGTYIGYSNSNTSVVPNETAVTLVTFYANYTNSQMTISNIQLEYGSQPTPYEPYHCDEIPVSFPAEGKNLYDEVSYPFTDRRYIYGHNDGGGIGTNSSLCKCTIDFIPFEAYAGLTITLNKRPSGTNPGFGFYSDASIESFISGAKNNNAEAGTPWTVTVPEGTKYMRFTVPIDATDIQIELGSISTEYEVYKGNTYFGGYVDLITGEVVQEWEYLSKKWGEYKSGTDATLGEYNRRAFAFSNPVQGYGVTGESTDMFCSIASKYWNYSNSTLHFYIAGTSSMAYVFLPSDTSDDTEIQLTAKLKTPITHTLSPQTLSTLVHSNAFWSNADSVEIEYDLAECGDIKEIRRRILLNTPHIESASGSVAHFTTDMAAKLKECKVNFLPQQAGSGDPSPSNVRSISGWTGCDVVRSGKNIVDVVGYSAKNVNSKTATRSLTNIYGTTISTTDFSLPDTSVTITQSQSPASYLASYENGYMVVVFDNLEFGKTYNVSFKVSNITSNPLNATLNNICMLPPYGTMYRATINGDRLKFTLPLTQTLNVPDRMSFEICICGMSFTLSEFMITPVEDEDYTYAPYDPDKITVSFPQIGKNYFNINHFSGKTGVTISGNTITATALTLTSVCGRGNGTYMPLSIASGNTITLSFNAYTDGNVGTTGDGLAIVLVYADGTYARFAYTSNSETTSTPHTATTTLSKDVIGLAFGYYENTGNVWYLSNVQLEIGSSATSFEPYTNTIYGGFIDVLRGELVQEWAKITIDGVNNYLSSSPQVINDVAMIYDYVGRTGGLINIPIGKKPTINTLNQYMSDKFWISLPENRGPGSLQTAVAGNFYVRACLNASELSDVSSQSAIRASFNEWFANNPTELCYPLETPITYPLSPEIIKAIKGVNNVFSDAGDVSVKFWTH